MGAWVLDDAERFCSLLEAAVSCWLAPWVTSVVPPALDISVRGGRWPQGLAGPGNILPISVLPAYGIGLLVTFMALALMQRGQPALLYLVPCTLTTSGALALWRRELGMFWTGSGFAVNTSLL